MNYLLVGAAVGIIWALSFYTDRVFGEKPKPSFKDVLPGVCPYLYEGKILIPCSPGKVFHLHHWMSAMCVGLVLVFMFNTCGSECVGDTGMFFMGFCSVLFLEGLRYEDSMRLIEPNPCTNLP